jgi:hypothetical protein
LKKRLWEKHRIRYGGLVELIVNAKMMLAIRTLSACSAQTFALCAGATRVIRILDLDPTGRLAVVQVAT